MFFTGSNEVILRSYTEDRDEKDGKVGQKALNGINGFSGNKVRLTIGSLVSHVTNMSHVTYQRLFKSSFQSLRRIYVDIEGVLLSSSSRIMAPLRLFQPGDNYFCLSKDHI